MTAQLNNNGDTRDVLVSQQRAIISAALALLAVFKDAAPHGRNYQTHSDPEEYNRDRRRHSADCSNIRAFAERALATGKELTEM